MTLLSFFGCGLIAFGPSLAIFFLYVARNAQLVLLAVSSAFFWLVSILIASAIWYVAKPAQDNNAITIVYSVLLQELFRWLLYKLINRAETGLNLVSKTPKSPYNRWSFAFSCGFGFGIMSGTISYVSLLAQSLGPGVILCPSCPKLSLYFVSAFTTCIFILLHIVWMMLAFEGFSASSAVSRAFQTSWVILTHLAASYATLLNASVIINLGCLYSIIACLGLLGVSSVLVIRSLMRLYKSSGSESASNAGGAGGL